MTVFDPLQNLDLHIGMCGTPDATCEAPQRRLFTLALSAGRPSAMPEGITDVKIAATHRAPSTSLILLFFLGNHCLSCPQF